MWMQKSCFFYLIFPLLLGSCASEDVVDQATGNILFNHQWEFAIDTTGNEAPGPWMDLSSNLTWTAVSLPHTPRVEPLVVNDQWQGTCWYRKQFSMKNHWSGKKVYVRFEGAMNVAEVWVNGTRKTTHYGGYLPFVVDITDDILYDRENFIHVRLNNEDNAVTGPKPLERLDFNMYGGLYRDVFLLVKNPVHITDEQFAGRVAGGGIFVTFPEVSPGHATVEVKTHLINRGGSELPVKVIQILHQEGIPVAEVSGKISLGMDADREITMEIGVKDPLLWSPETPHLYTLVTRIMHRGEVLDERVTRIGIRKFEFRENRLFINGRETFLKGVNRHQDYPYIGYALSDNAQYRDALKIKEAGFDYVRLSHYPHSPAFMDACDELGIVTVDAILGWQYYMEDDGFKQQVLQTCRELIRRDRNHPSVLAWEVSLNESWMPEPFIDSMIAIARQEYPGDDCFTAGWQQYGYDIYLQARQHRLGHPAEYPDKPYIVSEYGDWEYYAMNAGLSQDDWGDLLENERSSRQLPGSGEKNLLQQAMNIQEAHNDNFNTPAVADGYWVMYDYNRGYADDLEASGIMGIFRNPKFSYYFFQSQRDPGIPSMGGTSKPMVRIASYWNGKSPAGIRVYSNCEEVELLLNGKSLGVRKPDMNRISSNLDHPPFTFENVAYTPGKLTAIAFIEGREVARHELSSAGDPAMIILEADLSGRPLESGLKDVIFVHAVVTDSLKRVIHDFSRPVQFLVSGQGALIGESEPMAEAGIATILLMAGDEPGEITVEALVPGLGSDPLKIFTK